MSSSPPPSPPPLSAQTGYVVIHEAPPGFDASSIKIDSYPGLLFAQVFAAPGSATAPGRVVTTWQDEASYIRHRDSLLTATGLVANSAWPGYALPAISPRRGFLSRILKPSWILFGLSTAVAVLSNVDTVLSKSQAYVAAPRFEGVTPAPVHALSIGDTARLEFTIRNLLQASSSEVRIDKVVVKPSEGLVPLNPSRPTFADVTPRDDKKYEVTVRATQADRYTVTVHGTATNGWFGIARPVEFTQEVEVWPASSLGVDRTVRTTGTPHVWLADLTFRAGKHFPNGATIDLYLAGEPGIAIVDVNYSDSQRVKGDTSHDPNQTATGATWDVLALEKLQSVRFTAYIRDLTAKRTEEEMKAVVNRLSARAGALQAPAKKELSK